jgi:hypothetical protein
MSNEATHFMTCRILRLRGLCFILNLVMFRVHVDEDEHTLCPPQFVAHQPHLVLFKCRLSPGTSAPSHNQRHLNPSPAAMAPKKWFLAKGKHEHEASSSAACRTLLLDPNRDTQACECVDRVCACSGRRARLCRGGMPTCRPGGT